jgi:hypothetical protein
MVLSIRTMDMHQNIDIQQDHLSSITSSSAEEEFNSTPGCKPEP